MKHAAPTSAPFWGGLLLCAVLSACSHAPERPSAAPPADSSSRTQPAPSNDAPQATEWQGRLSLLVQSEPPQHLHAAFTLQGSPEQGTLTLTTPLGNVVAQAHWQAGQATLVQGEQQQRYASLDDLLRQTSLNNTPVIALFAWLQGQAAEADGWHVDLSQHAKGRIQANRQYPLPAAEIKIVVEQY